MSQMRQEITSFLLVLTHSLFGWRWLVICWKPTLIRIGGQLWLGWWSIGMTNLPLYCSDWSSKLPSIIFGERERNGRRHSGIYSPESAIYSPVRHSGIYSQIDCCLCRNPIIYFSPFTKIDSTKFYSHTNHKQFS